MAKLPIETLIENLGFSDSKNLVRKELFSTLNSSKHIIKTIDTIDPYAVYMVDNNPFILFIEASFESSHLKEISKSVWNSQIPIAIICEANTVKIFNGKSLNLDTNLLEELHTNNLDEISVDSEFAYFKISDPLFWECYNKQYSKEHLNDYLLDNITSLTEELKNNYKVTFATKLVLRLIFIRYLIDRGVDLDYKNFNQDIKHSQLELLKVTRDKGKLYELFRHLKEKFNGNLFELGDEIYSSSLTDNVLNVLADFLAGEISIGSGQISLFAMYDFNIIPVELISNIYEILLGKEIRKIDNAFYTPNYLAEYVLDKTTLEVLNRNKQYKILDPSCGSGVFLVNSYRRMVDINLKDKLYCEDDAMLSELLTSNIYGIDINEEAIDVTIFSLYLTVLDYKDPKTLFEFKLPNLKGSNLIASDFFDENKLEVLKEVKFDFIIGNPPWGSVSDGLHFEYCKKYGYDKMQQNKEISRSFVFRAKDFCTENTVCSFVLHSKLLYTQKNPSKEFRKFLLSKSKILNITEMSSVRKLVFKNADAPAVIISFNYNESDKNLNNKILYTSLKPNIFFKLFNIIVIEKYDVKYVPQKLLYENDWAWKTIIYGLSGDIDNIKYLRKNFKSIESELNSINTITYGAGIQDHLGEGKDSTHLIGKIILDSDSGINHFKANLHLSDIFSKEKIHRPRSNILFEPPYCVTLKGLDLENYTMRSAYIEQPMVCKETAYVIKGSNDDKDTLLNLTGLFNSKCYAYLTLMLGSSLGIEREQRFMKNEVLLYPYLYSNEISKRVLEIQEQLSSQGIILDDNLDENIDKLDNLILNLFNLNENKFVDYALNVQIPELTKSEKINAYRKVDKLDLTKYSECFIKRFTDIYSKVEKNIFISIFPHVMNRFTIFELEITDENKGIVFRDESEIKDNKVLFTKLIKSDYNDMFHQIKDVVHFTENSFYIIKPNYYKNWHPAIAELDLAEVLDQILSDDGGEE